MYKLKFELEIWKVWKYQYKHIKYFSLKIFLQKRPRSGQLSSTEPSQCPDYGYQFPTKNKTTKTKCLRDMAVSCSGQKV